MSYTAVPRVVSSHELPAQYGLDALSADGSLLYLIEPLYQYGPNAYHVPGPLADMSRYTLSIAPDGRSLYAINTVIGQAVAVRGGLPLGSVHAAHWPVHAGSAPRTRQGTAITAEGKTLLVATNHGIWAVSPDVLRVSSRYLTDRPYAGVALSRDGQRLYALERDHGILDVLDPASGRLLGTAAVGSAVNMIEAIASA